MLGERAAQVSDVLEVVPGAPKAAVNDDDDRVRSGLRRQAEIAKVGGVRTIWDANIGGWRRQVYNVFVVHVWIIAQQEPIPPCAMERFAVMYALVQALL